MLSSRAATQAPPRQPRVGFAGHRLQPRQAVATYYETAQTSAPAYTPAKYVDSVDAEQLNKRLEAKAKALIALEEQAIPTRPVIRIRMQRQVGLGDAWKIVGRVPELGRFLPEVAPYMVWSEGHVWTYEGHIRPGTWLFKLVLRRADGAYVWEEGPDRVMVVPDIVNEGEIYEMVIDQVQMPA